MARDIRVSTVVMAHPSRRHQAEQLQRRHADLDIQIVLDPEPDGEPATLRTAKLAWNTVREDATHQLVLQQDVQLCVGFTAAMHQALRVAPEGAIALHGNWVMPTAQAVRLAAFTGASWTQVVDPRSPTQALIIPAPLARQFAGYAERYSDDMPDNRAMFEFLMEHGLKTYIAVPNLVEHRTGQSLLLNDLFHGIRSSAVFPLGHDLGAEPFSGAIAAPPAVAHMGMGDFESLCHYEPLGRAERSTMNINEVLFPAGMTTLELEEAFASDLNYHPEAVKTGFGPSLLFQFWLTSFTQGIIARGMLEPAGTTTFDKQLDTAPWARLALGSFAASSLRRTCPGETLLDTAARITPLCITGMRAGFAAIESWPGLRALWDPDENAIRPMWNAGTRKKAS
ncbi:hypothetical protein AB0M46_38755 [Dactylosporangium sp. NPDC051485]|uniref:hypothetical protein n=1 Tax=Dactylosporangium sp. NPDC051485 TaxID=3154846 RepID=UPI00343B743E